MNTATLPAAEIDKLIASHFATSNALETAMCHLRACKLDTDAERELIQLNAEVCQRLQVLWTERAMREAQVAA